MDGLVATIAELKQQVLCYKRVRHHPWELCSQVEAFPVDHIDPSWVYEGLADSTQNLSSATTVLEKAEAQISVDVHSALNTALSG